jgi:hypothetical protein
VTGTGEEKELPTEFAVSQNYPNPFNPSTLIEYALPTESSVRLEVFGVLGQRIATLVEEQKSAGYHAVRFDAGQLPSGIYYYRIVAGDFIQVRKMLLVK